jgi:ABC-2 type transport system ATP-binding protein
VSRAADTATDTLPALTVSGLCKRYGDVQALRGVDLDIQRGEFFGLLGANGAGKSTLINILAGLVRPTAGHASVLGHDVIRDYRAARRNLGVVPQELVYDPFFNVREILRLQAGYFGLGRESWPWVDELLETLGLSDKALTNVQKLSGGMKRRVLIAQALVHRPPVLILDEPTAGVDVELRQTLWRFVGELHEQGHTIVLTTHYLEEAEALCERIAILDQGKLVAVDSKDRLLNRHPYRYCRVRSDGPVANLSAGIRALLVDSSGDTLTLRVHKREQTIGDVIDLLRDGGVRIEDLSISEPSLEEVFMEITGMETGRRR